MTCATSAHMASPPVQKRILRDPFLFLALTLFCLECRLVLSVAVKGIATKVLLEPVLAQHTTQWLPRVGQGEHLFLHGWRRCVCREAQVTLNELNGVTEKIRARRKNKAQTNTTKQQKHRNKPTKQKGLVSHQDCTSRSDCLEREVKRGIEVILSALSSGGSGGSELPSRGQ